MPWIVQLSLVSRLKHENFLELKGYCLEADNRILVYEYATMGSLHDILHGMRFITVSALKFYVFNN